MPSKLQIYREMADQTAASLVLSHENWTSFLQAMARLYKYPYHEQLMIYAQRPDATACASYEIWNNQMRRYVQRGRRGIVLIDTNGDNPEIKYVFDVSDTGVRPNSRTPYLFQFRPEHEQTVTDALADRFGIGPGNNLPDFIEEIANWLADDYWAKNKEDILRNIDGSYISDYDEENIRYAFHEAALVGSTYTIMARCGLNPDARYDEPSFMTALTFNTPQSLAPLGTVISQTSEAVLRQIEVTVKKYEREKLSERSQNYEQPNLPSERRLPDPQPEPVRPDPAAPGQVRQTEENLSEGTAPDPVEQHDPVRDSVPPSAGDRPDGEQSVGADDAPVDAGSGGDGSPESQRSDEVDRPDEQPESPGGGNDSPGADLQLTQEDFPETDEQFSFFASEAEQIAYIDQAESAVTAPSAFTIPQEYIDQFLLTGSNTDNARTRLAIEYSKQLPMEKMVDFIQKTYHGGYGLTFGETKVSAWYGEDGMRIAYGTGARYARTAQILSWEDMYHRIGELLDQGRFATNVELTEMRSFERKELAEKLWYMDRDINHAENPQTYMSIVRDLRGGFPDDTAKLMVYLSEPESYKAIMEQLYEWRDAYQQNPDIMRFRHYHPERVVPFLEEYAYPRKEYVSDMAEVPEAHPFITEDEINELFTRVGHYSGARDRLYDFYQSPHTPKEKQDYIKNIYGIGGGNCALSRNFHSNEWHDGKGIRLEKPGCSRIELNWRKVVKYYDSLMEFGRYFTPEEFAEKHVRDAENTSRAAEEAVQAEAKTADNLLTEASVISEPVPVEPVIIEQPAPVLRTTATQAEIDAAIQAWNGDIASKRAVVRYMEQHDRERSTAAWLQLQYGSDTFYVGMSGNQQMPLSWPKVQRRIAQLIKADKFYTEEEYDRMDNVDPIAIRERLAENGIENGEVVDSEKLDAAPIVRQAEADAQSISDEEFAKEHLIPGETTFEIDGRTFLVDRVNLQFGSVNFHDITFQNATGFPIFRTEPLSFVRNLIEEQEKQKEPTYTIKTEEYVSGEKSGLPYDVVFQTIGTREPEPPAPVVEAQNFRITDDALGVGGAKAKFRMNMDAIHLLQTLDAENRQATPEEQAVLSRYVGWGGLADAFDESKGGWTEEYKELSAALTPQEYSAARSSTLNAHYTSPTVIKAMYDAISQMGFQTGNILEPSMGVGNFFGMLPEQMQNSRLYGVELDSITGRIAKQLYPKANITISGFEKTDRRDFFDLAMGNVPFGQYQVNDPAYNRLGFSIHNYFFAKAMDQLRPGGVMAFVTSRYTMDAKNSDVRKYLAERAQFLGAIRLPNDAFKANAGTEVVSDIIFLQKRDRPIAIEPDWVLTGENKDGYTINRYFLDNPHMVLGEETSESSRFGQDYTVSPKEGISLAEQLQEAVKHIHGTYQEAELPDLGEGEEIDTSIPADPDVKNFSYTLVDGEVYYRENSRMVKPQLNATARERVKGMIGLRECVRELIDLQMDAYIPDSVIQEKQEELNTLYDAFAEKFGLINDRGNKLAFSDDSSYYLLCSLEVLDDDGKMERKADMFTKRTIRQAKVVNSVDTASEALAVSIGERACVDMAYMEKLTGKTSEELASELRGVIFRLPLITDSEGAPRYVTADEYLSGNVREKLSVAKEAAIIDPDLYSDNVVALEAAQPKDLEAHEIDVRLGATWIDKKYIQEFMEDLLDPPYYMRRTIKVNYSPFTAEWNITGKKNIGYRDVNANTTYGTSRINAYQILEDSLNLRDVQIHDVVEDSEGREKRVLNQKETTLAQQKQESIRDAFKDWLWKDPERRQALVQQYNELFNSTRPREYDGSHITFGGMSPEITLREHQQNAIAHILYGGNTLLAHEVGSGKTFEMVAAAMESKRLGLCSKSLIAVPNHLTEQWASEFLRLYPSANILVARKKDFEPARRKTFCAKIATGDYDAVIMGHSQFEKIPISMERQQQLIQQQIWEIEDGLEEMRSSGAERFSIKALEKTKKSLEVRLKKLLETGRKDDVVTFEQLGIDRLFVDEAHSYKNLFLYTKMRNVAGLSTTDAQKSSDMYMKCRYMDEKTGSRGVIFATGTPVSNSMTELYTMMRYLQHDMLQERKWSHFDCWASQFGETKTVIELAPEGTGYRARSRFAKFFNLPELINIWKEAADVKTADQLNLPRPTAVYHNEVAQPTAQQKMLVQQLSERAAKVHSGAVKPEEDNMLKITSDGRKLGLDQRIINPNLPDDPGSKVNMCVRNILRIWEDGKDDKLTQLVFCDISTPKKPTTAKGKTLDSPEVHALEALAEVPEEKEFTVYDDIRSKLIDAGVPAEQIAFIHDANTDARKKELFGKVRSGQVRVLMGSTFKMGAGMNVQDRLIALHDLDCPWRPGDLEQRSGRIIRQGNRNPEVHIYRYVTEGTFDSYLWQTVENKQKFISQIMTSKSPVRSCEDVDETALSYAEIKALCAGDPRIKEKMDLDIEVARLKLLKADHQSQQFRLEDNLLKFFPEQVEKFKGIIAGIEKDMVILADHPHPTNGFAGMTVKGDTLTDKDNAGAALLEACKEATGLDPVPIGTYRGFTMTVTLENFGKDYYLQLKGNLSYSVKLGSDARGNLVRIENELSQLPLRLNGIKAQLQNTYTQMENAKAEIGKPFPQEAELRQKSDRLAELNILLDMDGKGKSQQITDGAIVAKSDRPSVLDKLKAPAVHGSQSRTQNLKMEER